MNIQNKVECQTTINNMAAVDSSLKKWKMVDVSAKHEWLQRKYQDLIGLMINVVAETDKAICLCDILGTKRKAWLAKSLIQIYPIKEVC